MILRNYFCRTFTADDCVSTEEQCDSAEAAIARANEWRAIGMKATAYRLDFNPTELELNLTPLN